jgi:hypothetical protein
MIRLPDVIQVGPFPLPVFPLLLMVGAYLWYSLSSRAAHRRGMDPGTVEEVVYRVLIGGVLGAKLPEVVRSPFSVLTSIRLLVAVPVGAAALMGLALGASFGLAYTMRGRCRQVPQTLDVIAAPLVLSLGLISLGIGDDRSVPMAIGMALAYTILRAIGNTAAFDGHEALAAVVLVSVVTVAADFLRPGPTLFGGLTSFQLVAGGLGIGAYALALFWGSRGWSGAWPPAR